MDLAKIATKLLADPDLAADAARHAKLGNSLAGAVLTATCRAPREAAEAAVLQALQQTPRSKQGKA